jgi:hypothetical protein
VYYRLRRYKSQSLAGFRRTVAGCDPIDTDAKWSSAISTEDQPTCFSGIAAGRYSLNTIPPDGYGLTTAGKLELDLKPGMQLAVSVGAAHGYSLATASADLTSSAATATPTAASDTVLAAVYSKSGLILFGLAGISLAAGFLLLYRRTH